VRFFQEQRYLLETYGRPDSGAQEDTRRLPNDTKPLVISRNFSKRSTIIFRPFYRPFTDWNTGTAPGACQATLRRLLSAEDLVPHPERAADHPLSFPQTFSMN
jgi:hypothetical protein